MIKILASILFICTLVFVVPSYTSVHAQQEVDSSISAHPTETFYKARVEKITDQGTNTAYGVTSPFQTVVLLVLDGNMKGKTITIDHGKLFTLSASQMVRAGDTVLVSKVVHPDAVPAYQIVDAYRLDTVMGIAIVFFLLIIFLSGWQGVGSILGMIISLAVIIKYIVPQILSGGDPLIVSIIGCIFILATTIYLAHGFSKKTTIALVSTCITLIITGILSILFVKISHLTGLGNEDAIMLKLGPTAHINFQGLLLGGILIGSLGVLDDVTTGLSASIFELAKANPAYTFTNLLKSGLTIGREHIASLVNTLVLAYAGVSLPLFIIIVLNPNQYPMHVILNDGLIIEEVIRTLAGSIGLVMAVPLTAALAAYYVSRTT